MVIYLQEGSTAFLGCRQCLATYSELQTVFEEKDLCICIAESHHMICTRLESFFNAEGVWHDFKGIWIKSEINSWSRHLYFTPLLRNKTHSRVVSIHHCFNSVSVFFSLHARQHLYNYIYKVILYDTCFYVMICSAHLTT